MQAANAESSNFYAVATSLCPKYRLFSSSHILFFSALAPPSPLIRLLFSIARRPRNGMTLTPLALVRLKASFGSIDSLVGSWYRDQGEGVCVCSKLAREREREGKRSRSPRLISHMRYILMTLVDHPVRKPPRPCPSSRLSYLYKPNRISVQTSCKGSEALTVELSDANSTSDIFPHFQSPVLTIHH